MLARREMCITDAGLTALVDACQTALKREKGKCVRPLSCCPSVSPLQRHSRLFLPGVSGPSSPVVLMRILTACSGELKSILQQLGVLVHAKSEGEQQFKRCGSSAVKGER